MRRISFVPDAWESYRYWQNQDRKTLERINNLITEAAREPFEGTGKPEPLRGSLSGYWSRRINDVHRLVYRATDGELVIIACRFNYDGSSGGTRSMRLLIASLGSCSSLAQVLEVVVDDLLKDRASIGNSIGVKTNHVRDINDPPDENAVSDDPACHKANARTAPFDSFRRIMVRRPRSRQARTTASRVSRRSCRNDQGIGSRRGERR